MQREATPEMKYLWTLRLIKQFREAKEAVEYGSWKLTLNPSSGLDWSRIQSVLLPDVHLLMGKVHDEKGTTSQPVVVFAPEPGWCSTTEDEALEEAIRTTETHLGNGDECVRKLRNQVSSLQNANSRHKGERLLTQLEGLLE